MRVNRMTWVDCLILIVVVALPTVLTKEPVSPIQKAHWNQSTKAIAKPVARQPASYHRVAFLPKAKQNPKVALQTFQPGLEAFGASFSEYLQSARAKYATFAQMAKTGGKVGEAEYINTLRYELLPALDRLKRHLKALQKTRAPASTAQRQAVRLYSAVVRDLEQITLLQIRYAETGSIGYRHRYLNLNDKVARDIHQVMSFLETNGLVQARSENSYI